MVSKHLDLALHESSSPQARIEEVTQGVSQLHGFWYFEAERSFRQVAAIDPDCAMAYWGMAMANVNNKKRATEFIGKAVTKRANADAREQMWIDAARPHFSGLIIVGRDLMEI